ncbi:hypothetical protein OS493_033281 [Desmophyllum pertusum]|uniref:Uncharacterized protein n=1 Tax=Desmophyllum pertusum TaxID=174260 RepID=A0A9W9ZJ82_9CNID|nr:hypothetical protein OS493_033281 [Desmophyllum pertusum]
MYQTGYSYKGTWGLGRAPLLRNWLWTGLNLMTKKMEVKQGDALERFENYPDLSEDNEETNRDYENTASDDEDTSSFEFEENQKNALKKFELVLVINLKEVSKCQSLKDVVSRCDIFTEEETAGLLSYIAKNQEKVLLVFDGYDDQGKHSPARFGKVQDFKEILAEIGKVALECLLKDDHVFEYDQLSAAILCEESVIIGLLQVTEYAENLRPAGMVSFIHKSIQEFLAAWYITYRYVPEGNLGGIEEHARTLEDCETLENVFQFICGMSDDGAVKVLEHLTSVRISDPTLDLSKIIPDLENETDVPLCDVTAKHRRFSELVYNSFQEVHSKAELLSHCFDCTGGIVLVTKQLTELLQKAKLGQVQLARLLPRFTNIINLPLNLNDCCAAAVDTLVSSITHKTLKELVLSGVSLTPTVAAALGRLLPELSSLQTLELTGADGSNVRAEEMEALEFSVISCLAPLTKSFRFFPNLRVLNLEELNMDERNLCDLLESLRFIPNLEILRVEGKPLSHAHYCTAQVNTAAGFTHKTLRTLELSGISLTPAVATTLGRSLPEMSSLEELKLTGADGSIVKAEEMEVLFGGFNKTLPLYHLTFSGFSVSGCLAPLTKSLRFFPNLSSLSLDKLNKDEHDLRGLLESFQFIPNLWGLDLSGNPLGHAVTSIVPHVINLPKLGRLKIEQTGSEEDLNYVRETIKQAKPHVWFS